MGSNTELNKGNILALTYDQLPKEVRKMLEEHKKKRDEEDLRAMCASFRVDRRGNVTKIKEIDFTSTSSDTSGKVNTTVSDSSPGVTLEQI